MADHEECTRASERQVIRTLFCGVFHFASVKIDICLILLPGTVRPLALTCSEPRSRVQRSATLPAQG
jgi:hypothetical protein